MELNSLTLNSNTTSAQSKSQLAIYDHKLAVVNKQIFVFGKTIQNFTIQTPLYKINIPTLRVEPVFIVNAPIFQDFIMFSFEQNIYFWGKTQTSQINQLFEFDGCKFTKLDQNGSIPNLHGPYSFTIFSHSFILLFGTLTENQFQNKWYFFDIKKRFWKQIYPNIQLPVCQNSSLIWRNGRGYILMQSCYLKNSQSFKKNILYELKFRNFTQLTLELTQIALPLERETQDTIFTNLISFQDKWLMILGGQQNSTCDYNRQKQSRYDLHKIVYKFDLQVFEWSADKTQFFPIKGQNNQMITFDDKIIAVGGTLRNQVMKQIQVYDLRMKNQKYRFPYQQSVCYYCQSAFTYNQKLMYEPVIQKEYDSFAPKNKIQNKFIRKYAQTITNEIQAIGILCDFFIQQKCSEIKINLCQQIKPDPRIKYLKPKVECHANQIILIQGRTQKLPPIGLLNQIFKSKDEMQFSHNLEEQYILFIKMKIASYKLGIGFLYVASTLQEQIFVGYCCYSLTDLPEPNFRSASEIFYSIKINANREGLFSSALKRNIIFQNVKLHFGSPQAYQNIQRQYGNPNKKQISNYVTIYILGVDSLQKGFDIQLSKNKYFQDIRVKTLNKKNPSNSLRNYLKHLFILNQVNLKIYLQDQQIQLIGIYDKFQQFYKSRQIREIPTSEEATQKTQLQETHFSTNQDQLIINYRKIQIIEKCKFYEIGRDKSDYLSQIYNKIFLYKDKKLFKILSTKKQTLCGVIQLLGSVQTQLSGGNFTRKCDQRKITQWIQQIQNSLFEQSFPSTEEA